MTAADTIVMAVTRFAVTDRVKLADGSSVITGTIECLFQGNSMRYGVEWDNGRAWIYRGDELLAVGQ